MSTEKSTSTPFFKVRVVVYAKCNTEQDFAIMQHRTPHCDLQSCAIRKQVYVQKKFEKIVQNISATGD